jgi:hypothetical protein
LRKEGENHDSVSNLDSISSRALRLRTPRRPRVGEGLVESLDPVLPRPAAADPPSARARPPAPAPFPRARSPPAPFPFARALPPASPSLPQAPTAAARRTRIAAPAPPPASGKSRRPVLLLWHLDRLILQVNDQYMNVLMAWIDGFFLEDGQTHAGRLLKLWRQII